MAVMSLLIPTHNSGRFRTRALLFGVPVEQIDADESGVYFDAEGTQERILRMALTTGAQVLDTTFYRQSVKINNKGEDVAVPGVDGEGIPNGYAQERVIMDVSGGTLDVSSLSRKPNR